MAVKRNNPDYKNNIIPTIPNLIVTIVIILAATLIGFLFHSLHFTEANIITIYILGVLLTSLFTKNYICSGISSLASVLLFNFLFTEPRLSFRAYESGYPVTFGIMLFASLMTGTLANRLASHAKQSAEAALLAKNEQLRANLLRSISHDLRTPLTSISGNAENLLVNGKAMEESDVKVILNDIYEDSIWLIRLMENLLSITKIGEGQAKINLTTELVEEVISESLRHIHCTSHVIETDLGEDILLAQMDARLISQVIVNLIDNAIKYSPEGTMIRLTARKERDKIIVSVYDNGPGIEDEAKSKVFEMFYTGDNHIADCRRSMGLGLALCKAIMSLHNGSIAVRDNVPTGSIFYFTLPISEVTINE